MSIDFENTELTELTPKIAVIGVGGAGGNAVNNMIMSHLQGVDFVVANTDAQALSKSSADNRIQLGVEITRGLGAGAQPKIGEAAAEEALERVDEALDGAHMAFITAGMGGGTGTGAAPVIAKRARERGILTVGVVTKPFQFEGARRMKIAEAGIQELAGHVDTLIIVPNQNLFRVANERTTFAEAFNLADEVLHSGVRGITDLMVMPGLINLDFADVRTVMSEMGKAMMGTGEAEGETRAQEAAAAAISNPLLEEASLKGAKGVIINVTGGMDMTLYEVDEAVNMVRELVDPEALIVFGSAFSQELDGKLRVSVVATGIEGGSGEIPVPAPIARMAKKGEARPAFDAENLANEQDEQIAAAEEAPEPVAEPQVSEEVAHTEEVEAAPEVAEGPVDPRILREVLDQEDVDAFRDSIASDETADMGEDDYSDDEGPSLSGTMIRRTPMEEEAVSEDTAEERAVAAQGSDTFVADAPMMPKSDNGFMQGRANVFQEAAYASGAEEQAVEESAEEAEPEAPAGEEGGRKRSLFQLMTAGIRGGNDVEPGVAANETSAPQQSAETGNLGGVDPSDRPVTAKPAKVPSFLKRQQN